MCGVAGIYAYHYASNPVDRGELERIRDHMHRRGPDASGVWIGADGAIGLAHRRLAIIDLDDRANQPMASDDGAVVISFNGEIYNYKALRRDLESRGCRMRTHSDTEVLLHLYRLYGDAMFSRLRGMYAFILWDAAKRSLLLARDPYGIKPLYYADDGWTVRAASQVKALVAGGGIAALAEPAGVVGFYLLGSVPEPYTLHQEIRAVPAGQHVWVTPSGAQSPVEHFSIARAWAEARAATGPDGDESVLRDALIDSVRHHLVADVPVGAFLSSGIDSGALVGLMRDAGQEHIKTVTIAFDEFQDTAEDESPLAAETALRYETEHHLRRVTQAEFRADLPRILEAMDQPSIDGINTWFVAKATAEQGLKVAISGLGGDELFGGYPSFRDVPRWVALLRIPALVPGAAHMFRQLTRSAFRVASPKAQGLLQYGGTYAGAWFLRRGLFMPWELAALLDPDLVAEGLRRLQVDRILNAPLVPDPGTPFARVSTLESALYMRNQLLRDTDWASMAHSLEARVPLVDATLLRAVAAYTHARPSRGKAPLVGSPATPLPARVVSRAKTGFGIPVAQWLQEDRETSGWRRVPALRRPECPWARRWSHVVGSRFGHVAA